MQKNSSSLYSKFILNLFIIYLLNDWSRNPTTNLTVENCLSGQAKLTRNADKSKFTYNGCGIAFGGKDMLTTPRNVVTFWC